MSIPLQRQSWSSPKIRWDYILGGVKCLVYKYVAFQVWSYSSIVPRPSCVHLHQHYVLDCCVSSCCTGLSWYIAWSFADGLFACWSRYHWPSSINGLVFCQYNLQSLEGVFHGSFRGIGCFYTSMVAGKCIFLSLIINQCILINVFVATSYGIPGSRINCPSDYAQWWWPYASFVSTLGLSTYTLTHLTVLVCMLYSFMFLILLSDSPMSLALSGG